MMHDRVGFGQTAGRVGFVSWGAFVAVLLTIPTLAWVMGESAHLLFDAVFPAYMIALFFGRIGCVFYGCYYGAETETPLHLRYVHPALKVVREGVVCSNVLRPVQLLSALNGGLIAVFVFGVWYFASVSVGVPAAIVAALYGFARLSEGWLRVQRKLLWGIISPVQLAAAGLLIVALTYLALRPLFGEPGAYASLNSVDPYATLREIHLTVLFSAGLISAFVFSYHRRYIGSWK